jgi:hypothetical protein
MTTYSKLPAIIGILGAAALSAGTVVSVASLPADQQQDSRSYNEDSRHAVATGGLRDAKSISK